VAPDSFKRRVKALQEGAAGGDPIAITRVEHFAALLGALRRLPAKPAEENATFKRVQQAKLHELWRVAHPFDPDVAVRIIVWFPPTGEVVVAVFSFDKAHKGNIWYSRAAVEGQAVVDQWLREHPEHQ
jgi:hypothetical protein